MADLALKPNKHSSGMHIRLNVFFFTIFLLFSILIIRLSILQFVESEELKQIKNQSSISTYEIPPIRGHIYDRQGQVLAESISTQTLYYQYDSSQSADALVELASKLEEIFETYGEPGQTMSAAEIMAAMDSGYDINKNKVDIIGYASSLRKIKSGLTDREMAYLMEHRDVLPHVEIIEESIRQYNPNTPEDQDYLAVQLIGYLRPYSTAVNDIAYYRQSDDYLLSEMVGLDGIELMYESELRGSKGMKTYPINARGEIIGSPVIDPPTRGHNVYLTIDKHVQLAAERKIEEHLNYLRTDPGAARSNPTGVNAELGYAVAMEVDTGKVVAMASFPDYDPNIWRTGRISNEMYQDLQYLLPNGTITGTTYPSQDETLRRNRPGSLVPLGSTMKVLTVLLGMNEGLITPTTIYQDPGIYYYGKDNNADVPNAGGGGSHRRITAEDAIALSTNTFMAAQIGNPLYSKYWSKEDSAGGIEVWDRYMKEFGLGVLTGSRLPGEITGVLDYYGMSEDSSPQFALVNSSFGQGARYTVLQLAQYTAMIANRGDRMRPQLVDRITTYDGVTVQEPEPEVLNHVELPEAYWDVVERGMLRVGKTGFDGFEHSVAVKTGTSEMEVAGGRVENAVFIAYAPVEDPKLAVAVVVPEGGYGSWGAAPIARTIFDAYDESIGLLD